MIRFLFYSFLIKYEDLKTKYAEKLLLYKLIKYARTHNYNLYLKDGKLFSNDISINLDSEINYKFFNNNIIFTDANQKDRDLFKCMMGFLWNDTFYPQKICEMEKKIDFEDYGNFMDEIKKLSLRIDKKDNYFFLNLFNKNNDSCFYYNIIWDGEPSNINLETILNFEVSNPFISDHYINIFVKITVSEGSSKASVYKHNFNNLIHEVTLNGSKEENIEKIKNLTCGISLTEFAIEHIDITDWKDFSSNHIEQIHTLKKMMEY